MPKDTFMNLNEEKREKVEKAMEKEFARATFEKASVSRIVKDAEIPRGSFYQYFEDKEDAIRYIVQKHISLEHKMMYELLLQTQGDIFDMAVLVFEKMTNETKETDKRELYKNIMKEIKKNNIDIFDENLKFDDLEQVKSIIDKNNLNIQQEDSLKYIMKILVNITRSAVIEVIDNKVSIEQGKADLQEQLKILKRGMLKNQ
mgnify:CR=1 FL=1